MRYKLDGSYHNSSVVSPVSLFSRPLSSLSFFLIFILLLNITLFVNLADATILEPDFFSIGYACKDNLCIQNNSIRWLINITNQGKPLGIAEIKLKEKLPKEAQDEFGKMAERAIPSIKKVEFTILED